MRIACPHCGLRDAQEFTYLGDAKPVRPKGPDASADAVFDYVYLRDNPAGPHRELWYHGAGCHAWLVVTRDTRTHAITAVEPARSAR
jgi:sarcosine oxidase subunit delta